MVRWIEGQTEMRRLLRFAAIALVVTGGAGARAAQVQEVRVGTHDKSTRIVVELDQATGYKLVAPQEGKPELVIQLNASSVERDVPSKSPVVRKVSVEPSANGATVHVRLATANVDVKELLLANPPRLVFDLTAHGPLPKVADEPPADESAAAAAPVASAEPAKVDESKPAAEPKVAEPRPEPKPVLIAAAEPAKPESAAETTHPIEPKPAMPPAPVEPAAEAPAAPPAPPPMAQQPVVQPPPAAHPMTPPPMPPAANADVHRDALAAKAKTMPASTPNGDSWTSLATSPMGLAVIGAAVLLLGFVVVMRRRRSLDDEDPLYTVMAAEDAGAPADAETAEEPAPTRAAPIWEPDAFEASEPTPKQGPHQLAFGARPAPEPEPAIADDEIAPPDDSDSIFGGVTEPTAAAAVPAPVAAAPATPVAATGAPMSEDTERRLAELERRIEQLAEARERLERQVAAQTEELRVQRAAIARTQRVVRSIAKTEDMATEPVPRAPSAS